VNLLYPSVAHRNKAASLNDSSTRRADALIVTLITLVSAWIRLAHLGQPSLWWDEFITVGGSLRPLADMLTVLMSAGPNDTGVELFPPLHHAITHALVSIARSDILVRLPGTLAGVALIPAAYLLCRGPLGRLSALVAALGLALSVYHVHYSREVRPYSLFLLENVLALHCLHAGLTQGRKKLLWGWGAACAAMLYTSYMAATLILAQVLFAAGFLLLRWRADKRSEILVLGGHLAAAGAIALLAYLPWVPGQLLIFKLLHDPTFKANFSLEFVASSLKEFAAFASWSDFPSGWAFAALGAAGFLAALAGGRTGFALLMALWAFMPIAGIFLAKARMELSSRYLVSAYFFLSIFAAHLLARAVERAADRLGGASHPIFAVRLIAAAALCVALSLPNLSSLPEYYSRETSRFKDLIRYLLENRDNRDAVLYYLPRNLKLVLDWYAPEELKPARALRGGGYLRSWLLAPDSAKAAMKLPQAAPRARFDDVDILSLGVARTPVIPMIPDASGRFVYHDDFSAFRMLEDAFEAENLVPSPMQKTLTRHDAGLPARALYRFQAEPGTSLTGARLAVKVSVQLPAGHPTDDELRMTVSSPGRPAQARTLTMEAFKTPDGALAPANHERKRFAALTLDLTQGMAGASSLDVAFESPAFSRSRAIEIEDVRLEADLAGPAPGPDALPLALLRQLPVAAWTPGVDVVMSRALHAFSLDGGVSAPGVGAPDALAAYLRAHPDARPVRVLPYAGGRPAVALYDPYLADPWLTLAPGAQRALEAFPPGARTAASIKVEGRLDEPVLDIAGRKLALPVKTPGQAALTINPNRRGELIFSPLFTEAAVASASFAADGALRRNPGEDCLSCEGDATCSVTYAFSSGLPVTAIRIVAFPRVEADWMGRNAVRTLLSAGGGPWREVNLYRGAGSGRWEGLKIPQYSKVALDKPARDIRVRFELSNRRAQLWSAPDARMRFELSLDASALPAPYLDRWPARLTASGKQSLRVLLLDAPTPFRDDLARTR
jgi:hypothetical protein